MSNLLRAEMLTWGDLPMKHPRRALGRPGLRRRDHRRRSLATPALADKRVALVIGNSAYKNAPHAEEPGQ